MSRAPRQVLVVEDESSQRLMYARALKQIDFQTVCVGSGEEARRELASDSFAITLLDLNLSGEHGLDIFEMIRERYPSISVVIATGYGTFDIAKQAIRMDVVDFLSKPIGLADLESAINRAWSRHVLVQTPVAQLLPPATESDDGAFDEEHDLTIAKRQSLNLDAMERDFIMEALRRCDDSRKAAARALGISERKLYYRLTQYRVR